MKSVGILNNGLNQIKTCENASVAQDITGEIYVKLIKGLFESVDDDERKAELREKLLEALVENDDLEEVN